MVQLGIEHRRFDRATEAPSGVQVRANRLPAFMRVAIFVAFSWLWSLGCTSTGQPRYSPRPTFDDYVSAEIRTVGHYVLADPYAQWAGPPDNLPCEIGTIFGTHFDLIAPPVPAGSFLLVVVWSRAPIDGGESDYEIVGNIVHAFSLPFSDPSPGTYLTITLNEGPDLVAGRYRQLVTTGSGKPLFSHDFLVPECPAAFHEGESVEPSSANEAGGGSDP